VQRGAAQADPREVDAAQEHSIQLFAVEHDRRIRLVFAPPVPGGSSEFQIDAQFFGHALSRP
jgi:hypothetical protein